MGPICIQGLIYSFRPLKIINLWPYAMELSITFTPFQNGSIEAKKGARQKFVHFWKALTILMLKKYLKS